MEMFYHRPEVATKSTTLHRVKYNYRAVRSDKIIKVMKNTAIDNNNCTACCFGTTVPSGKKTLSSLRTSFCPPCTVVLFLLPTEHTISGREGVAHHLNIISKKVKVKNVYLFEIRCRWQRDQVVKCNISARAQSH